MGWASSQDNKPGQEFDLQVTTCHRLWPLFLSGQSSQTESSGLQVTLAAVVSEPGGEGLQGLASVCNLVWPCTPGRAVAGLFSSGEEERRTAVEEEGVRGTPSS